MREVTATDAARKFSDVLDAVEHRQETFLVTRGGKTVAFIGPAPDTPGLAVKEVLRRHHLDRAWSSELRDVRGLLATEDRSWPD
jgi:prevent-host-death family protein